MRREGGRIEIGERGRDGEEEGAGGLHIEKRIEFREEGKERTERERVKSSQPLLPLTLLGTQ